MSRVVWKKGKFELVHTDHLTLIFTLHKLPKKSTKTIKVTKWNMEKEDGWRKYEELSNKSFSNIIKEIDNNENSVEKITQKFKDVHTKIMFGAFGKITRKIVERQKDTIHDEDKIKDILKRKSIRIEEQFKEIRKMPKERNIKST